MNTKHKFTLALLVIVAITLFVMAFSGAFNYEVNAAPAPTRTPIPAIESTPEPQYWELLEDEAVGYLLTHPDCFLGLQDLGGGAYRLKLDCEPQ